MALILAVILLAIIAATILIGRTIEPRQRVVLAVVAVCAVVYVIVKMKELGVM